MDANSSTEAISMARIEAQKPSVVKWGVFGFLVPLIAIIVAYARSPSVDALRLATLETPETQLVFEREYINVLKGRQTKATLIWGVISIAIMIVVWVLFFGILMIAAVAGAG